MGAVSARSRTGVRLSFGFEYDLLPDFRKCTLGRQGTPKVIPRRQDFQLRPDQGLRQTFARHGPECPLT